MIVNYKTVEGSCTTIRVPCGREIGEVPDAWNQKGGSFSFCIPHRVDRAEGNDLDSEVVIG